MSDRYALVRNGVVENVILWDGDLNKWQPPQDIVCVPASDQCGIGWTWDGETFSPPIISEG